MNEIDLVRNFRAETETTDEEQAQRARIALVEAIKKEDGSRASGLRGWLRRPSRGAIAIILAVVALPGAYAIADSADVFEEDGTVTLTPENAVPALAPGEGEVRESSGNQETLGEFWEEYSGPSEELRKELEETAGADSTDCELVADDLCVTSRKYDDPLRDNAELRCATWVDSGETAGQTTRHPECRKPNP